MFEWTLAALSACWRVSDDRARSLCDEWPRARDKERRSLRSLQLVERETDERRRAGRKESILELKYEGGKNPSLNQQKTTRRSRSSGLFFFNFSCTHYPYGYPNIAMV